MLTQIQMAPSATRYDPIQLNGGLDLLTPVLQLKPGYLRDALNFEQSVNGGYARIQGYERHDGRPAPSAAQYLSITATFVGVITAGATILGSTSGATGIVLSITDGSIIAFARSTGSFVAGETVTIAGTPVATNVMLGGTGSAPDWDATQLSLAANLYRADIGAVPGSGPIRGVVYFNGVTYAWRNNVGGTALAIYKSTTSGWVSIPLGTIVAFTAGSVEFPVGSTITKGGTTATVLASILDGGAYLGGTASGRLIVSGITGGSFTAGAATGSPAGAVTISGAETAITLQPGGRVETDIGNLGPSKTPRVYWADGVNPFIYEFDGTVNVPSNPGVTGVAPRCPLVHKEHLFGCFGSVLKHSGIGTPYDWSVTAGGAEYKCAGPLSAIKRQPGNQQAGAMSISLLSSTEMFYGTSVLDFQKVTFEESAGGRPYGAQQIGSQTLVFGDIGVFSIAATQNFGNFIPSTITQNIRPFTEVRRTQCTGSVVNRSKSQYRVFFNDGSGLYITSVNGKTLGSMPVQFPNKVTCACAGETLDGNETSFFGSDNGFVYRLDAGTSHDGLPIMAFGTLTFAFQGNSRIFKRYRGCSFEIQGSGYASFDVTYELDYGEPDRPAGSDAVTAALSLSAAFWDAGYQWDTLSWDGRSLAPSDVEFEGTGENIAVRIDSNSDKFPAFTINSIILHYTPRKARKK